MTGGPYHLAEPGGNPAPIGVSSTQSDDTPGSRRVQERQLVDLVLNSDLTFAAVDAHGDQMVSVLTGSEKGSVPIGPVFFTRDYVRHGFFFDKKYPQGGQGVVLRVHKLLGRVTHVDLRLPDGKFLLGVPIDYIRSLD